MCGIAGAIDLKARPVPDLGGRLDLMGGLLAHRGPDGSGSWAHPHGHVGFAHRRLAIIDLVTGDQPMKGPNGNVIAYNGEIYNYVEVRADIGARTFATRSDTEVILAAYEKWGGDCLDRLRGMFSFALWDEESDTLFCARDRLGIKPFYYAVVDDVFYFASEAKALLPFLPEVETDPEGLKDYLAFQFCLAGKTLFKGVRELPAGHTISVRNGLVSVSRYWEVYYEADFEHTHRYFERELRDRLFDSAALHLRSDVPLGGYVSGGVDSSIVASLATQQHGGEFLGFSGRFDAGPQYDESRYARLLAEALQFDLIEIPIGPDDFVDHIADVIYHMDYPVAGPGSFSQFMVSREASKHRKVVLGGQGGDEVFGGYARYLIAYFEQCLKAAINGTMRDGTFVVTYESIIPSLRTLDGYQPLLQEFWRDGLFDSMDRRYFRLVNRAPTIGDEVRWEALGEYSPFETFREVFNAGNVGRESYFDLMTHFDFKTLLPALLHVEDRVSMAHGLESRVPLLDHPVIELAATMPADVKFLNGRLKHVLKDAMVGHVPREILDREDKMGFPTPLTEWVQGPVKDFVVETLSTDGARGRHFLNNDRAVARLAGEKRFGRTTWGLLSLELWQQAFHDKAHSMRWRGDAGGA